MADEREEGTPDERAIVQAGDPVLRAKARTLSTDEIRGAEIRALVGFMRDVMRAAPGVGLAAPQIGRSLRMAVIEDRAEYLAGADPQWLRERERAAVPFHVIFNPELEIVEAEPVEFFEGCLSVAGFTALVPRARAVRVRHLDERGEPARIEARGWYARILQHEIDHLEGMLYVDRMHPRSFMTAANHARHWRDRSASEVREALRISPARAGAAH